MKNPPLIRIPWPLWGSILFFMVASLLSPICHSDDTSLYSDSSIVPLAPSDEDYEALLKTSPFTRVLSLSETYALRGVAKVGNSRIATLYNKETKTTIVVTPDGDNDIGISLVEVTPSTELSEVTAKVAFAGDEAELHYEESQINPDPNQGNRGQGAQRHGPAPQDVERWRALPPEQQAKLREYIGHVMRTYPNMSRDERGNLIRGAVVRLTDGRDIEIPKAPPAGSAPANAPAAGNRNAPAANAPNGTGRTGRSKGNRPASGNRGRN